jgi:glycosyltransferase involved in cell wall biosynthesis
MGVNLAEELTHTKAVLRGTMGNIKDNDFLLVWTGGIWDWFDALTVIRAMGKLKDHEDIKLVFLGTKHPNDEVPAMAETDEARKLARELGMLDKTVYFRDGWIDYAERINYLLEADAAIYAHKPSIEARFSHRTRVLDHILAGLPTIATEGDYFADLVRDEGLGLAVVPGDVNAMAEAILNLRRPETMKAVHEQLAKVKPDFGWDKVLGPLVQYIERTDPKDKQPVPEHRPMVRPAVYRAARRVLPFRVRRVILRAVRMFQQ